MARPTNETCSRLLAMMSWSCCKRSPNCLGQSGYGLIRRSEHPEHLVHSSQFEHARHWPSCCAEDNIPLLPDCFQDRDQRAKAAGVDKIHLAQIQDDKTVSLAYN